MSMKKNLLAASILLAVMGGAGTAVVAEHYADQAKDNHSDQAGASRSDGSARLAAGRSKHGGVVPVLSGTLKPEELETNPAVERARQVLQEEKRQMASSKGARKQADDRAIKAEQYTPRDVMIDADGTEHVRFARTLDSLPVIGGGLVTHTKDGRLQSVSKTLDLQLSEGVAPAPKLSTQQAIVEAGAYFDGKFSDTPDARVVYFADDNQPKLAYEVNFQGIKSNGDPANELIYVDAGDGSLLGTDSRIQSATSPAVGQGHTVNRGLVQLSTSRVTTSIESGGRGPGFLLRDDRRGGGTVHDSRGATIVNYVRAQDGKLAPVYNNWGAFANLPIMFDLNNTWSSANAVPTDAQKMAAEVHYGVSKAWDYYLNRYGRQGIGGNGRGVKSFVNITGSIEGVQSGAASVNAFQLWDAATRTSTMYYMNGNPGTTKPVVAMDVAAHEMSHGVTAATSGLIYDRDSGGLNEASSDIHGVLAEYFDNSLLDQPDYLLGEMVYTDGHPFRYLFKPSLDTHSHDCYPVAGFGTRVVDAANDPHYTSGVGNHFFYLLAEGQVVPVARFNQPVAAAELDCRNRTGLVKAGIGREAAGRIWYRASTQEFVEQTSYPQARAATQKAARELVALGQIPANTVNAVACAWDAVSVPLPAGSPEAQCVP